MAEEAGIAAPFDLDRSRAKVQELLKIGERGGRVLILMQNNPDPDAIASAYALRHILKMKCKKRAIIGFGGMLGRAENRAMVQELKLDIRHIRPKGLGVYETVCLVDAQPRSGNNVLVGERGAAIVIDHHVLPKRKRWSAELCDVRPHYGATATILYEYLLAAQLRPNARLATMLYYGIQSDTQELGREANDADIAAFQALVPQAEKRRLARIRRAPLPPEYFAMLSDALTHSETSGTSVVTLLRDAAQPDMFAEIADLTLRLDSARTSVCYGPFEGVVYLSARAADARGNAAARMRKVVKGIGTGGGHRSMAGGQVPIPGDVEKRLTLVRERVLKHFGGDGEPEPLIPEDKE